jgi:hypothetical protein
MPYHYSRARKQLIADLGTIKTVLSDAYSAKCSSVTVREFALCSAVVLTSAKVETYLETLVADWGKAVLAAGLKTDALHPHTRAFLLNEPSVESIYKKLGLDGNEGEFIPALARILGTPLFSFSKNGENIPPFQIARVYSNVKYPSPKNFRKLFRRLGIDPVFAKLNAIAKRDVESLLTSFNDVRTEMAHQGMPVGMTVGDIKARIKDVSLVVGYVDRLFYSQVCKTVGVHCWTP